MSKQDGVINLKQHIVDPIEKCLNRKLENYRYYDVFTGDMLTTNGEGVDIVAHQLELKFEDNDAIFISWGNVEGWFTYSLCVSETSFVEGAENFVKLDKNWQSIVGKRMKSFEIFGYETNEITSTEVQTNKSSMQSFYFEPHLLVLEFENDVILGIANFYLENNFEARLPMGDDIWIMFGWSVINSCSKNLSLEKLDY